MKELPSAPVHWRDSSRSDVSPRSVSVKLCDFGLARLPGAWKKKKEKEKGDGNAIHGHGQTSLSMMNQGTVGFVAGTFGFMAPEILNGESYSGVCAGRASGAGRTG